MRWLARRVVGTVAAGALLMAVPLAAFGAGAPPCLSPPVAGEVVDGFRAPDCPYCAGNRGLELRTEPGAPVTAAAAGTVTFAGTVAAVRYVVVDHGDGFRTTYGRLGRSTVQAGERVARNAQIGVAASATFFGLRFADEYLDPAPLIATVTALPQLVPLDGTDRRPRRAGRLTCPSGTR